MAASTVVVTMPFLILFVLLAATATAAAATPTDVAIDEAYAHLVNITGDQEHWAERAEEARAYNRAEYMSDPVAVMDRFEDAGDVRAAAAAAVPRSPPSLPRKFRAGARAPTPSASADVGGAAAQPPASSAPSSSPIQPPAGSPASSPTPNRGNLQHAVVEDSTLWMTFSRDIV